MIEAARLGFAPFIPWTWLWVAIGLSLACWVFYLLFRGRAWLTRAFAVSLISLALANPLWVKEQRDTLKDIVAIVLDTSESMKFGNRTNTAQAAFESLKTQIENDPTLELRTSETPSTSDGTDIYQALNTALSDAPRQRIAGAFIISDGQAHDLPENANDAADLGPVHSLIVGNPAEHDRRVEIVSQPTFGIVGKTVDLTVNVTDTTTSSVTVFFSINGEFAFTRNLRTGADRVVSFELPRRGPNLIVAEVGVTSGELTPANNRAAASIEGVRDRLRVLLVTGEPHSGARVWRDLLKADPSVDLVHFTILRPPNKLDPTPLEELALISFPTRELFVEKLQDFDLVIFDQYKRINVLPMTYFDGVARYVADGGALLVATGPPYALPSSIYRTPLASILPARPTGRIIERTSSIHTTETGKRHTVTGTLNDEKSWGRWERYIQAEAGHGDTLLETDTGDPLLVLNRVDKGRVAVLLSDQLWMWARGFDGGGPYAELVRRTAHWLMKEPELEEEHLRLSAKDGHMHAQLRSMSDTPAPLTFTLPSGAKQGADWSAQEDGMFESHIPAEELGMYTAQTGDTLAMALNGPANPREYRDVRSTLSILEPIANATNGGLFRIGDNQTPDLPAIRRVGASSDTAGDNWVGLKKNEAYAILNSEATPLLPGIIGVALLLLFVLLAWRREGR